MFETEILLEMKFQLEKNFKIKRDIFQNEILLQVNVNKYKNTA